MLIVAVLIIAALFILCVGQRTEQYCDDREIEQLRSDVIAALRN